MDIDNKKPVYVIYDLEYNQATETDGIKKDIICPFEIIQIGAYKYDSNLNIIGEFNYYVKPTLYLTLHPWVEKLVKVRMSDLMSCKEFSEVCYLFYDFCKIESDEELVLGSWGFSDVANLYRNIEYHKLPNKLDKSKFLNIQSTTSVHLKQTNNHAIGLRRAVELLEIDISCDFHDALNDSFYTGEIFKKVISDNMAFTHFKHHEFTKSKVKKVKFKI